MDYFFILIVPFFIAFFSAFIAAYIVSFAIDSKKRTEHIKIAKENIVTELEFICKRMLYPYGTDEITDEEIYFDTPIWNTVVSNGYILTIRKHEAFFRAALASYRQLELLREEEKKIVCWDKLSTPERIDIINERRRTREIVGHYLKIINDCFKERPEKSEEHKAVTKEEEDNLEELKNSFRKVDGTEIIICKGENEFLFNGRDIKKKGIFFQSENLKNIIDNVSGYEARYGIGFGEYDCEIYLHVWEDVNITDTGADDIVAGIKKKLGYLVEIGEKEKTDKKIVHTSYEKNINEIPKIGSNYSRLVLASKSLRAKEYTGMYSKTRIEESTIQQMAKDLLDFEKEWLLREDG